MNTSGLRCIDIDTDDRAKTEPILQALRRVVGNPASPTPLSEAVEIHPVSQWCFGPQEGTPKKRVAVQLHDP